MHFSLMHLHSVVQVLNISAPSEQRECKARRFLALNTFLSQNTDRCSNLTRLLGPGTESRSPRISTIDLLWVIGQDVLLNINGLNLSPQLCWQLGYEPNARILARGALSFSPLSTSSDIIMSFESQILSLLARADQETQIFGPS